MADFGDDFAPISQDSQFQEEDPAAAFLAREQTELAGLEDYTFGGDTTAQDGQGDYDPFGGQANGDFQPGSPQAMPWESTGRYMMNDDGDFAETAMTNGPSDAYSAISQADRMLNEPEKIRIWREEQKKMLEKKDLEEEKKKNEWMNVAKKEIEDWYKHHEEQLVKTKENNRQGQASEQAFVKDRDKTEPGEEWEKICRLCEFNPKNSKNTKDVSRLRSILLQLKQTPLVR